MNLDDLASQLLQWHRVAEIRITVSNPPTIEANELRVFCNRLDLLEFFVACQNADMTRMISLALLFRHLSLLMKAFLYK